MNSEYIITHISETVALGEEEKNALTSVLVPRPFKQGEMIIRAGEPSRYLMFVNEGYLMTYFTDKTGLDHVVQFAKRSWWGGDIYGLSAQPTTPYSTRALTDGDMALLPRAGLQQLFDKYIAFEKYFRIYLTSAVIRNQMRFAESLAFTAEERYVNFQNLFPGLDQYVAQKYIASFLGITPEFLSKIRRRLSQAKS